MTSSCLEYNECMWRLGWLIILSGACVHPEPEFPAVQVIPSRNIRQRLLPQADIRPARPDAGLNRESMGYVVVEYDLDAEGNVVSPHVVFGHPPDIFDGVALERIQAMRVSPVPDRRRALRTKFAVFADPDGHPVVGAAFISCRGLPYVDVEFDIAPNGRPVDPHVVAACPAGMYDQIAVKMVEQQRFPPGPTRRQRHRTRLTFGEGP